MVSIMTYNLYSPALDIQNCFPNIYKSSAEVGKCTPRGYWQEMFFIQDSIVRFGMVNAYMFFFHLVLVHISTWNVTNKSPMPPPYPKLSKNNNDLQMSGNFKTKQFVDMYLVWIFLFLLSIWYNRSNNLVLLNKLSLFSLWQC